MRRTPAHTFLVYFLLIAGAITFAFPFVWMVSGSVKVDREQFQDELRILPSTPHPAAQSPYVDETFYDDVSMSGTRRAELMAGIERLVVKSGYALPADVDAKTFVHQVARGLLQRLSKRLPADTWAGPVDQLVERARPIVDRDAVQQTADAVYRYLGVGPIRVRGSDIAIHELAASVPPSQRWKISGDATTHVSDVDAEGRHVLKLGYDFGTGPKISLQGDFELPIAERDLKRVQIDIHPDDSWHDFRLIVEHGGKRYVARRDSALSNFEWATFTWQNASEDDDSTKLKTWIINDEAGASPVIGDRALRLTLVIERASQATAWANKVKQNYIRAADQMPLWRYVRVSLFLVIAKIALTVFGSSLAAYAFARIIWPGRELCFVLMLATMMIPPQVTMIPNFLIWKSLGAYDTLSPLWVGAAFGNAFFIFMLRQFMRGIPRDLEDAARIDGCGFMRIYWHVILPLITPSLAAIAVMTFIGTWNDFMGPLIYIADQRLYPLAFGIYAFSVQVTNNASLSMAASVMMTVPIVAIFFFAQRYFIQGITLTGMKG